MKNFLCSCILVVLFSCAGQSEKQNAGALPEQPQTGDLLVPGLQQADSMQVLYFDDPGGDPKRYARFFTYTSTNDTSFIHTVRQNLLQKFRERDTIDTCRSEGKIYVYKNAEPIKTLYFSTRCRTCCHLYFIHNGRFYYFDISAPLQGLLKEDRRSAQKPDGEWREGL